MVFPAVKVEVAFNAGFRTPAADRIWTDISARVDSEVEITWGRSTPTQGIEPMSMNVVLDNSDGHLTAENPASPYYSDVRLDRPVRVTVTPPGGSPSVRGVFYADEWPTTWPDGSDSYSAVNFTATSRTGRMGSRNALESIATQSAKTTGATQLWPLDEASESVQAMPYFDTQWGPLSIAGSGNPLTFTGNGVQFAGGEYLSGPASIMTSTYPQFTIAATFAATARPTSSDGVTGVFAGISLDSTLDAELIDGVEHRYVLTYDSGTVTEYVDGVSYSSGFRAVDSVPLIAGFSFVGTVRDLAFWPMVLSGSDVTTDYLASTGGLGLRTDEMLELLASFGNIPLAEVDADTGSVIMGGLDTTGLALLDAMKVVESTESGYLIDARNGDIRLIGRRARYGTSPVVTLDMGTQQVGRDFAPVLDRALLRNKVTGTNAATNLGEAVSYTAVDEDSVEEYGEYGGSREVNAADSSEAYAAASWVVANFAEPRSRVPSLPFNFMDFDASDQAAILNAFLGDRVSVIGLPLQAPDSSMVLFLEGGTEYWGPTSASMVWNVSPIGLEDSMLRFNAGHQFNDGHVFGY